MKTIALYSIKGGVGKTAACVNLAYLSANERHRTLLSDLDPQGSATFYFRIRAPKGFTKKAFLHGKKKRDKAIKATDFEFLDVLPSILAYRRMDIWLDRLKHQKRKLRTIYQDYEKEYDYLFIDCPPNITLVSENIFRAADILLVPVIPTTLSIMTFEKLVRFFKDDKLPIKKMAPFFSMVERRKKLHREIIDQHFQKDDRFLESSIPYASVVEKMGLHRQPIFLDYPHSAAALAYRQLWTDLKQRLL